MLATSKNVLFPGPNHMLTTGADDMILQLLPDHKQDQCWWLVGGYGLKIRHF